MDLAGQRTLVTGASGGLGAAISRALHAHGANLVVTGRRRHALEALAKSLDAQVVVADLSDPASRAALVEAGGDVDVLVANAALPADGRVLEYRPDQIDRAIDVNLAAPIHLARVLAPRMIERGHGHLVFMSSLSGKVATAHFAIYAATKFGLRGFASGLRQDLACTGVGVSCVFPGFIRDVGMFAETGVVVSRLTGTRAPEDVGRAVVTAIERNRAEIDVVTPSARLFALAGAVAPDVLARLNRRLGGEAVAAAIANSPTHRARR